MNIYPKKICLLSFQNAFCILFSVLFLLFFSACKKQTDYFSYVSELRSNILLSQTENYKLRIFSVEKESPYTTDGVKREMHTRTEIYFLPKSGDKTCAISFSVQDKTFKGEMSYDNVKGEYYFFCSLDSSSLSNLLCSITYGEEQIELNALSVRTPAMLRPQALLKSFIAEEKEYFSTLTDKYGFAGEIYMRLIYEERPYYYIGVIDRNGKIHAGLLNAESGKVLAKRQS